jgi:hypothetical protein
VPPALPYKKHSSEQMFAQPTKEDNNNNIKYHSNYFTVIKFYNGMDGLDEVIPVSQCLV